MEASVIDPAKEASDRYWGLIGTPGVTALTTNVVAAVRTALTDAQAFMPPIELSRVAPTFAIRPHPRIVDERKSAGIRFVPELDSFVIQLPRPLSTLSRTADHDSRTLRHQRFSYAHEFAHRFFFVRNDSTWERAITVAVRDVTPESRVEVFRHLHLLEERVCNRIAVELLVPIDLLDAALACFRTELAVRGSVASYSFQTQVLRIARDFGVTPYSLLLAIQRSDALRRAIFHDSIAILVRDTSRGPLRTGGMMKSIISITPDAVRGEALRPVFNRIAIDTINGELAKDIYRMLGSDSLSGGVRRDYEITFMSESGRSVVVAADLATYAWSSNSGIRQALIWGRLQ